METKKKYLVTGGAGFIGSNIAKTLEAQGHEVTVMDDFSKNGHFKNLIGFKGDVIAADCFTFMPRDMYFDAIFHEAAITDTTVMDQKAMMEQNVEAFKNVLTFAAENEIKKVIYASSAATYGNGPVPNVETQPTHPENVYGFSKVIMDNVARQFAADNRDMTIIGLRYFNVYGPGEYFKGKMASMVFQLYNQMREGKRPRVFKNGEQQRDFVYVKDIVKINMCALRNGKETGVYNAATGIPRDYNAIIACLNKEMGLNLEPEYIDNPYPFFQLKTQADMTKSESKLGYTPDYTLEAGIADYVKILNEHYNRK
ncbi:ADP-glyceromanno-heptose 6-epimerase [Candidatus Avelusimicrobium faecicola]|uniref:ADP-glyceromanno-heptose 6-epimerase n=1 Tax=Candidatus Avelusimicrobium faecicola TaxID=3416205 RepID=UPI002A5BCCE3|nr:ADP-glyceromanno-heptose 6-epimerase [Spirochaetota bacterium]MDE3277597.1 ADP-glyceromanno-heptose 6-epimerase [Spirochaetota bacterium]MDY2939839.1 ADP-glyceromanno-heptose 6-epimerase [Elusimicrobiaceae bacterium]MDY6128570.1 ADP-glyceromanno-heptose 6-epimerase [Elusimicrobiaceae bacterium]